MFEELLKDYWEWTNLETFTKKIEYEKYVYPRVYKRMQKRAADIFNHLEREIQKGVDKEELKTKYKFMINQFWDDLYFLNKDYGKILPRWMSKGLTKKQKEEIEESHLPPIVFNGCHYKMLYHLNEILFKEEYSRKKFIDSLVEKELELFWKSADLEELTEESDKSGWYISPEIYKKMKSGERDIFYSIGKKIQEGTNLEELKNAADFLSIWFWDDWGFLLVGEKIPKKISEGLTKEQEKKAEESCINELTWHGCREWMMYHLKDFVFGKEHFKDF